MESLVIFSTVCLLKNCRMRKPHKTELGLQSPTRGADGIDITLSLSGELAAFLACSLSSLLISDIGHASWGSSGYEKKLSKNAFKRDGRTSLITQWLRIHLPTQGTGVQSLVQGDPTCRRATEPMFRTYRSLCARTCAPGQEKLFRREACARHLEKDHMWVSVNKTLKNKHK